MERDTRRSRKQWRGCYTFDDIICDGEGSNESPRTGGLKMASTYYYYYELDDGTEVHDAAVPFTTACPYMPGQPVNILWVPVEVPAPRLRSGSVDSIMHEDLKTMRPADRFMTPRARPSKPSVARSASQPSEVPQASTSPRCDKPGWASKFFGRRSRPSSPVQACITRRSSEPDISHEPARPNSPLASRAIKYTIPTYSAPTSRVASPVRSHPYTLQMLTSHENPSTYPSPLVIPDEIPEEHEDDDNFSTQLREFSFADNDHFTGLAPPPAHRQPTPITDTSKPLPQLPQEAPFSPLSLTLPRSHFSVSTISTALTSPTESQFGFSDTASIYDSYDESEFVETGEGFTYNPMVAEVERRKFAGYSLPDGDYSSQQTIVKDSLSRTSSNDVCPRDSGFSEGTCQETTSALEEFFIDLGYLGKTISDN
ncbi:Anaphase-promoting complex subunit 4 protein [Rutstroemia sp. NJR-2017a BVV2]|nr:Anaphase-promoting complex subunit 4 protein [Rutstroemia sp. NJR-2017a BVV2]